MSVVLQINDYTYFQICKLFTVTGTCFLLGSNPIKGPRCSLEQDTFRFERDFTIELNQIEGIMEDWHKRQISPLVRYRQHYCTGMNLTRM